MKKRATKTSRSRAAKKARSSRGDEALYSINSPKAAKAFAVAAERYAEVATKTKASARSTLIELGIYTRSGKFAKPYS